MNRGRRAAGRHPSGDRGSASVWVLGFALAVVVLGVAVTLVGSAFVTRHRAQVAADLGALAGAPYVLQGPATACARARELVSANDGRLTGCRTDGTDLVVAVELRAAVGVAHAGARAGPVRAGWTPDAITGAAGTPTSIAGEVAQHDVEHAHRAVLRQRRVAAATFR